MQQIFKMQQNIMNDLNGILNFSIYNLCKIRRYFA